MFVRAVASAALALASYIGLAALGVCVAISLMLAAVNTLKDQGIIS
jgi:hypothetical protein